MKQLEINTLVRWTSQASGTKTTKVGNVRHVVASNQHIRDFEIARRLKEPGAPRDHTTYLIVDADGKVYWPRVKQLEVCVEAESGGCPCALWVPYAEWLKL